jgi:hypothetical protein
VQSKNLTKRVQHSKKRSVIFFKKIEKIKKNQKKSKNQKIKKNQKNSKQKKIKNKKKNK